MKKFSVFFFLAVLSLVSSCQKKQHAVEEEATFLVTTPLRIDTMVYKDYVGQIRSIQHIEIRALEKGYLQKIYVDEGQFVKKGQLMFQIMPIIYQAETQKAEAEVNYVEIEYRNTKSLADSNIVSKNELALAKAKLDKAKAELSLSKAHLGFTEVRAPFDGIMDRFQVRLGSLVDEGELLTTLSDNSKMWVYFNVPEAEYLDYTTRAKSNSPVNVKLRMANNEFFDQMGKVETIEADFDNETGNIAFRATLPNPKRILRHGETGNILMPVLLKNALLIPQKATFEILDKKYVYVVDDKGIVHSRQITVGTELPHIYAVTTGLKEGENVLIEGLRKVRNEQHIKHKSQSPRQVFAEMNQLFAE